MKMTLDHTLIIEAKLMVAMAFRNGPIEGLRAGKPCVICSCNPAVSHIPYLQLGDEDHYEAGRRHASPTSVVARKRSSSLS
jgi:hypothetical protein